MMKKCVTFSQWQNLHDLIIIDCLAPAHFLGNKKYKLLKSLQSKSVQFKDLKPSNL